MSETLMREYIEAAAETAALRVAAEVRKDLSKAHERIGRIENFVGVNAEGTPTGNGIKGSMERIERRCASRSSDCETKFNAIRTLATSAQEPVNKWKWLFIGGTSTLSGAAFIIGVLYKMHGAIK